MKNGLKAIQVKKFL